MQDKLLLNFIKKEENLSNIKELILERRSIRNIFSGLFVLISGLIVTSDWWISSFFGFIFFIFAAAFIAVLLESLDCFLKPFATLGNNAEIVNYRIQKNKTEKENDIDLFSILFSGLTESEKVDNMDKIIVYAVKNNVYDFLEGKMENFKINNEYIYKLMVRNELIISFLKNLDLEKRLNVYFSKEFQDVISKEIGESYVFDIKRHIIMDSMQEYVNKDLSGYDNELYTIAQEVDVDKKSLYILSQKMKKELNTEKTIESKSCEDLVVDINNFKNESILKF